MGVADNKSYKDQYHFKNNPYGYGGHNEKEDLPSLNVDSEINTTIKANPYVANVEIEKDEVILQPDLTAMFKAKGKKHSGGGMDVYLKPDSFVFSNDKSLSFDVTDHKRFELKALGNKIPDEDFKKKNYKATPAEVLKKNVDIEHYNKLVAVIDDPTKDDIAKNSAMKMLEKYLQTVGNIAYIQEGKKNFPTGVPEFAMGTAPVYDDQVKEEMDSQKQYAKHGGKIDNPYLPKAQLGLPGRFKSQQQPGQFMSPMAAKWKAAQQQQQILQDPSTPKPQVSSAANWGLWKGDVLPYFQNKYGTTNAADKISDLDAFATEVGYTGPKDNAKFQRWLYDSSPENRAIIDKYHNNYGDPNITKGAGERNRFDGKIGIRWTAAMAEMRKPKPTPGTMTIRQAPTPEADPVQSPKPTPGSVDGVAQGIMPINWQFSPWQKISQMYNLGKYASVKRYMPMRSHLNASYMEPALMNPEQAVGDMQSAVNQNIRGLSSLSPILRGAQAAAFNGDLMDKIPGVRSQYDNQNVQILNNARSQNNQIRNNESMTNMQNDAKYYQESVQGRQNFDNMKTFMGDQYMNNLIGDVETNQKLAYGLASMNNPAYGYDFKTGNFYRNPKEILDVSSNGRGDYLNEYLGKITKDWGSLDNTQRINLLRIMTAKGFTPDPMKKGGKMSKRNPYKTNK